jgi:hypothetical protein
MPWVRGGYCCRCGQCCVGDPFDDTNRPRTAVVAGYCPLFEWHMNAPEGPGFCAGHTGVVPPGQENPYYLAACSTWPDDPHCIANYDKCTYTFTWVDD